MKPIYAAHISLTGRTNKLMRLHPNEYDGRTPTGRCLFRLRSLISELLETTPGGIVVIFDTPDLGGRIYQTPASGAYLRCGTFYIDEKE